ncbi:MAG: ABC transporter permease [Candidatus Heimdallarchaeaceae archaeon]
MRILTKKIFREIWRNKFRSILMISVVSISLMLLAGMRAGYPILFNTYKLNQKTYNVADGIFTFSNPIQYSNLTNLRQNTQLLETYEIDRLDGRICYLTEITYKGERFQAIVIGVNYPNDVNQLVIEEKSADIQDVTKILDSNDSCLVEIHFAGRAMKVLGHNVTLDDEITVKFPKESINVTVKGIAQDSYFSYLVDEVSGLPLMGNLAVLWMNLDIVQELRYEQAGLINQILFTVKERFNKEMILPASNALTNFFTANNIPPNSIKFVIYDESPEYKMFQGDAGSVDKMGTIFGVLGMIICIVVIFNTLNKMINAQRKNIGLFLAMGSKKRTILFHYVNITSFLALIGVMIGIPLAYGLALGMAKIAIKLYGFHQLALTIPKVEFIYGTVAIFSISFVCSILSAWSITTATPREAMSVVFVRIQKTGKSLAEKVLGWLSIFNPIYMLVPLREVFLKRKKTIITILALVTSMIFLVNSLSMVHNSLGIINKNFSEFNTYDIQIILETPVSIENIKDFMKTNENGGLADLTHYEIFIDAYSKVIYNSQILSWTELLCYQENSTLRKFNVIKGKYKQKSDLGNNTILLGKSIAGKYDIEINDELEIGILGNYSVKVAGLVGEMIDYSILWTYEAFQESGANVFFGFPKNWVNGIIFTLRTEENLQEIRAAFENRFDIAFWIESDIAKEAFFGMMEAMLGIMVLFLGLGLVIGVVFSFQSMYMSFVDRHQDFLSFKAMGTKPRYLRRMIFWENAILSTISLILTIPFGYLSYIWSIRYMVGDRFYIPLIVPAYTWPVVFLLSLFSIWLATGRLMRKIKKMNLADEIRKAGAT